MKLTSLFSGSSGNCLLLEEKDTKILIDAGVSARKITTALNELSIDPKLIDGILITHEHSDHIAGVGVLVRKFNMPVYSNKKTYAAMLPSLGKFNGERSVIFENDEDFDLKDICIHPFTSSHDAADPVGFRFTDGRESFGVATDLGIVTENIAENLMGCRDIFLEANHDLDMLMGGVYPMLLKQRILSDKGHLSNESAGFFAAKLIENGTQKICLGHLSAENNYPLTAYSTVKEILAENKMDDKKDYILKVALRDDISESMD